MKIQSGLLPAGVLALGLAFGLSACGDREADADTAVAEAEVSTDLPEEVVSDEQLQATADAAAVAASGPPPTVVAVPVESGQTAGSQMQGGTMSPQTPAPAN